MFTAYEDTTQNVGSGSIIDFPNVHTNIGNHYSTANSIFTCPHDGLYEFHVHIISYADYECEAQIMMNNDIIVTAWAESTNTYSTYKQASNHVYINGTVGDEVWIEAVPCYLYSNSDNMSTFSGRLIQKY